MKSDRVTDARIIGVIRQAESHLPVPDLCLDQAMPRFTGGAQNMTAWMASTISQMKALEEENRRLKRMYADLSIHTDILKEGP